jgi:hypothetical protein
MVSRKRNRLLGNLKPVTRMTPFESWKEPPNRISLVVRLLMVSGVMVLAILVVYLLAVGMVYVPTLGTKQGRAPGFLLSGVSVHLLVASLVPLALAAILVVVDHYDRARNRAFYLPKEFFLLKTSGILFGASLLVGFTHFLLDPGSLCQPPQASGFLPAAYLQGLLEMAPLPNALLAWGPYAAVAAILIVLAIFCFALVSKRWDIVPLAVTGLCMNLFGGALMLNILQEIANGSASMGRRALECEILLKESPHAFLAVELNQCIGALLLLLIGTCMFLAALAEAGTPRVPRRLGGMR